MYSRCYNRKCFLQLESNKTTIQVAIKMASTVELRSNSTHTCSSTLSPSVLFCYQQETRSSSRKVVNLLMIWSARVLSSPPSLLDNPADTAWKWSCATLTASLSVWLFSSNLRRRSVNFFSSFSLFWSWDWSFRKIKKIDIHYQQFSGCVSLRSSIVSGDNLVLSTGLIMWIGHRKEIRKLTFRALALRWSESGWLFGIGWLFFIYFL